MDAPKNRLLCLVGLHGAGKTTIAKHLSVIGGFKSVSVGDLGRLARKGKVPNDVPSTLMVLLSRVRPGSILDDLTVSHLIGFLSLLRRRSAVVVDGFPACPRHVQYLDSMCMVAQISVPEQERQMRLIGRGESSVRKWTPGGSSARDQMLDDTLAAVKQAGVKLATFPNDGNDPLPVAHLVLGWANGLPRPQGSVETTPHTHSVA